MNARALVWRVTVPVSAAFLLLVAWSVAWRAPAPYPGPLEPTLPELGPAATAPDAASPAVPEADPVRVRAEGLPGAVLLWAARPDLDEAAERARAEELRAAWDAFRPTALLVGPEPGFLLPRLMDPVRVYGEEGAAIERARAADVPVWTWAPDGDTLGRALIELAARGERAFAVADAETALRLERPLRAGLAAARTEPAP